MELFHVCMHAGFERWQHGWYRWRWRRSGDSIQMISAAVPTFLGRIPNWDFFLFCRRLPENHCWSFLRAWRQLVGWILLCNSLFLFSEWAPFLVFLSPSSSSLFFLMNFFKLSNSFPLPSLFLFFTWSSPKGAPLLIGTLGRAPLVGLIFLLTELSPFFARILLCELLLLWA